MNSKQSSDEQMGPFFDDEQLKLDFFGKQAAEHERRREPYTKFSGKKGGGARKAAAAAQEDSISLQTGKKHKEKKGEADRKGMQAHSQRADPDKMMVNNFMMDNENNNSSLQ